MAQCESRGPEPFLVFVETFRRGKAFAINRTKYPLLLLRHGPAEPGVNATNTRIRAADDTSTPALADYTRAAGLQLSISSVTVRTEKPDSDWLLTYHFVRKDGCWFLERVEEHSL